jgi:hypothetical protein
MHRGGTIGTAAQAAPVLVGGVLAALLLAGCTAATPSPPTPTPTPDETGSVSMTIQGAITPEETCAELMDINTLLANQRLALQQGRVSEQEYDGLTRVVARAVHRIEVGPGYGLTTAVDRLREATGTPALGAMTVPFDPDSPEWAEAFAEARDACIRYGVDFGSEMWTGG